MPRIAIFGTVAEGLDQLLEFFGQLDRLFANAM